jgi:hypothetical protein
MTGNDERSWSWLYNVAVPVLLAGMEAAWASAWISALAHVAPGTRTDLPFLALALPAAFAAAVSGGSARLPWRSWRRTAVVAPVVAVGAAVSAGIIGTLYLHGAFGALSTHPWTVPAGTGSAGASLAWFVAALAWGRGTWLAWEEPGVARTLFSVVLSALAFTLFFLAGVIHHHEASFRRELGPAAVLLVVFFPVAVSVLAVVNERDLEGRVLPQRRSRPTLAWLVAVLAPMLVVALAAVVVALGVRPLAPVVGRVLRAGALRAASVLVALARWLARAFHTTTTGHSHVLGRSGPPVHQAQLTIHVPAWIWAVAAAIGGLGGALVLLLVLWALSRIRLGSLRQPRRVVPSRDEQRDSVFTWEHLVDQVLAALRRLFHHRLQRRLRHRRNRPEAPVQSDRPTFEAFAADPTVRHHYRRVLAAAATAGLGRAASETVGELESRLSPVTSATDPPVEGALRRITDRYERARYGEEESGPEDVSGAELEAGSLVGALLADHPRRPSAPG